MVSSMFIDCNSPRTDTATAADISEALNSSKSIPAFNSHPSLDQTLKTFQYKNTQINYIYIYMYTNLLIDQVKRDL